MILHRIVKTNPPTADDFTSAMPHKPMPRLPPELQRLQTGISAYRTLRQAMAKANRYPMLGSYIGVLDLPAEAPVSIERTTQQRGHFTIWAEPPVLLGFVIAVVPRGGSTIRSVED